MAMQNSFYRYDRTPVWMAHLSELPDMTFLLALKALSRLFACPLTIVSAGHRRCIEKLCRYLAFPVF